MRRARRIVLLTTTIVAMLALAATAAHSWGYGGGRDAINREGASQGRDEIGAGIGSDQTWHDRGSTGAVHTGDVAESGYCYRTSPTTMMCDVGNGVFVPVTRRLTGSPGSPGGDPTGTEEPARCVPSWRTTSRETRWWPGGAGGEHWWGTRTIREDGCGDSRTTNSRVCGASECVRVTTECAWDDTRTQVDATMPTISTSPEGQSIVQVATWFWHDEWANYQATCTHPQAPVTVTVVAEPFDTWWDHGQGEMYCEGEPQPFDFGLLDFDEDPDADCNSHRYTFPSLETGPGRENFYELRASVNYERDCQVAGVPGSYTLPRLCTTRYENAPEATYDLPVYELQTVFR
jgi:hypothetical protein